jgi:TnpA family transposase
MIVEAQVRRFLLRRVKRTSWGALGLVVNALILWTTRYMNAALNHLHATGADVKKEDLARLSPSQAL